MACVLDDIGVAVSNALATSPALLELIALLPKNDSKESFVRSSPFSWVGSSFISMLSLLSLFGDDICFCLISRGRCGSDKL